MDWLTFASEFVRAVAWPVTVLGVVWLLRRELRQVVPGLKSVKFRGFEIAFGERAAMARAEAARLPGGGDLAASTVARHSANLAAMFALSPRAAIVEAWRELELAARQVAVRREVLHPGLATMSPTRLAGVLSANRILDSSQVELFHELRALRNQAAHAPEFVLSEGAVRDYVEAAARLAELLRRA